MPRAAADEAKQAQATNATNAATFGGRATEELGPLTEQAQSLTSSKGYDPATLSAITSAGMGATTAPFNAAEGQIQREAARTQNPAGTAGSLDALAMDQGIAGGKTAEGIQIDNANFQNQQRMAGLNLLNSIYNTNVQGQQGMATAQTGNINAQTNASPGWAQTFGQVLNGVGGVFKPATGGIKV